MMPNKIISFVEENQKNAENLSQTLKRILKDKALKKDFFNIVLQNPRQNKPAYRLFASAFNTPQAWHKWIEEYNKNYHTHVNAMFKKAEVIEDVIKCFPNVSPWTLEQRFNNIKIGQIPDIFNSETQFLSLVAQINKSGAVKNFKTIKKLECSLPEFEKAFPAVKKIDWFNFTKRSVFLRNLLKSKCAKPFTIKQDDKKFQVAFLCNPFSNKMVFQIDAPDGRAFILKMSPYTFLNIRNDRVRKEHENLAIRADSTYSDSLLEFYLKLNNCKHVSNILYYNFKHEVALYELEKGKTFRFEGKQKKYSDFYSFNTQVVPDVVRLGVYVNDINEGNFIISDKDNVVKIIDIGHATFANPLTPEVPGLTFTLGNLCGQNYISINGVLDIKDV